MGGQRVVADGKGGIMVMERDSTWGLEHTMQHTDDIL